MKDKIDLIILRQQKNIRTVAQVQLFGYNHRKVSTIITQKLIQTHNNTASEN